MGNIYKSENKKLKSIEKIILPKDICAVAYSSEVNYAKRLKQKVGTVYGVAVNQGF